MLKSLLTFLSCCMIIGMQGHAVAQETVFSGPQVGEAMGEFRIKGFRGELNEKEVDVMELAKDGPVALFLVHKITRPGFGLTNAIAKAYAAERAEKGLVTAVVFLNDDPTSIAGPMQAIKDRMPKEVVLAVASDGAEGPGSYGLNRNVTVTVLVGNKGKVVGNFALVQPSLPSDGPKIVSAMAKALGEKPPTKEELMSKIDSSMGARQRMQNQRNARGRDNAGRGNARAQREKKKADSDGDN